MVKAVIPGERSVWILGSDGIARERRSGTDRDLRRLQANDLRILNDGSILFRQGNRLLYKRAFLVREVAASGRLLKNDGQGVFFVEGRQIIEVLADSSAKTGFRCRRCGSRLPASIAEGAIQAAQFDPRRGLLWHSQTVHMFDGKRDRILPLQGTAIFGAGNELMLQDQAGRVLRWNLRTGKKTTLFQTRGSAYLVYCQASNHLIILEQSGAKLTLVSHKGRAIPIKIDQSNVTDMAIHKNQIWFGDRIGFVYRMT